jgi:hypothetical protein
LDRLCPSAKGAAATKGKNLSTTGLFWVNLTLLNARKASHVQQLGVLIRLRKKMAI